MKNPILTLLAVLFTLCGGTSCRHQPTATGTGTDGSTGVVQVSFNADSAFASIQDQCRFGPRVPGSEAHRKCGDYIVQRFRSYGLSVTEQKGTVRGWDNRQMECRNLIASYLPDNKERILICAHWDSRPWADADPDTTLHRQPVMAANDGASGVAVMIEIARLLPQLQPKVGVDFACFDVEDYGAPYWADDQAPADGSDWCLGSRLCAQEFRKAHYTPRFGILLDMVGGDDARFCYEGNSMQYAKDIVYKVWNAAETAGAGAFFPRQDGTWAMDDHIPLNEIAFIPTIDIIPHPSDASHGFCRTWHTAQDTPENISRETLKAVGQTLLQLLGTES